MLHFRDQKTILPFLFATKILINNFAVSQKINKLISILILGHHHGDGSEAGQERNSKTANGTRKAGTGKFFIFIFEVFFNMTNLR